MLPLYLQGRSNPPNKRKKKKKEPIVVPKKRKKELVVELDCNSSDKEPPELPKLCSDKHVADLILVVLSFLQWHQWMKEPTIAKAQVQKSEFAVQTTTRRNGNKNTLGASPFWRHARSWCSQELEQCFFQVCPHPSSCQQGDIMKHPETCRVLHKASRSALHQKPGFVTCFWWHVAQYVAQIQCCWPAYTFTRPCCNQWNPYSRQTSWPSVQHNKAHRQWQCQFQLAS